MTPNGTIETVLLRGTTVRGAQPLNARMYVYIQTDHGQKCILECCSNGCTQICILDFHGESTRALAGHDGPSPDNMNCIEKCLGDAHAL